MSDGVIPTSVWTATYQVWGHKADRGNAFSIGVSDIFVGPNVDNGFLLQLGAERVLFVLHRMSDKRPQRSGDRSAGIVKSMRGEGTEGGANRIGREEYREKSSEQSKH